MKDFLRGPDFESINFFGPIVSWIIGIALAAVVVVAFVRGAFLLISLAGADSRKAREVGEGLMYCIVAAVIAFAFNDVFLGMFRSARDSFGS
ncbi:MAG TPA: hypothetical protein VF597_04325 [Candidatus Saccharimonadales bacterium]|jgi:hypothetical protein